MRKDTEKIIKEIEERLKNAGPISESERERIMQEVMAEFNDDPTDFDSVSDKLLDEAYREQDVAKARKLTKQAIDADKNNLDAKIYLASLEENEIDALDMIEPFIKEEEEKLRADGRFEEKGAFWGILETRPYMRALSFKFQQLKGLNRYNAAIELSEYMLELCEGDNMGVRYELLGLYALLERFEDGEKLFTRFGEETLLTLVPYAIMEYKKGEYGKVNELLDKIEESNEFFIPLLMGKEEMGEEQVTMYQQGSKEEAYIAFDTFKMLLLSVPSIIMYIDLIYMEQK